MIVLVHHFVLLVHESRLMDPAGVPYCDRVMHSQWADLPSDLLERIMAQMSSAERCTDCYMDC